MQARNRVIENHNIASDNIDSETVSSFGEEWNAFHGFSEKDIQSLGNKYFDIVNDSMIGPDAEVIDVGCGSGRFIKYFLTRFSCKQITGIDPSSAIFAADSLLGKDERIVLVQAAVDNMPFPDNHFDFGYSLGVLHHIPDTQKALNDAVAKIKPGGHFLLYLYYNLDNRSRLFKIVFYFSNLLRRVISRMPSRLKKVSCDVLAIVLYMPFVLLCRLLKLFGVPEKTRRHIPLQGYEDQSFYIIRNDSLDRFGTPLEQRFSRSAIQVMMEKAGLSEVVFSEFIPYWHAVGKKK